MLIEEAEKLLEKLVKELGDEVISGYIVSTSISSSISVIMNRRRFPSKLRSTYNTKY